MIESDPEVGALLRRELTALEALHADTDAGQPVRARLARWRLSIPPT